MLIALLLGAAIAADNGVGFAGGSQDVEIVDQVFKVQGAIVPDGHLSAPSDPVVCKTIGRTGTRFPSRVCKVQSGWNRLRSDGQAALVKNQSSLVTMAAWTACIRGNC